MDFDSLEIKIDKGNKIVLSLFNIDYIIEKEKEKYVIYPSSDINNKKYYNSINNLFREFTIYNESLLDNIDKIELKEEMEII